MPDKNSKLRVSASNASCQNCSLADLSLPHGLSFEQLGELDQIVQRKLPYQPGEHVFRTGDESRAIFAVRSGALKNYCITESGDEQVLGFTLPGELCGFDGMYGDRYHSSSVVLETASVCGLPLEGLEDLCRNMPQLHRQMMEMIGQEKSADQKMLMLLGKLNAEERLAVFLLGLSRRYSKLGRSATEFNLPMSRQDIGNYLGLAIETVSRLFAHFQAEELITVNRRQVKLADLRMLNAMVEGCSGYAADSGK